MKLFKLTGVIKKTNIKDIIYVLAKSSGDAIEKASSFAKDLMVDSFEDVPGWDKFAA